MAFWRQLSQFLYFKKTKLRSAVGVIVTGEADKDFETKLDKHKYQYFELPNVDYSVKTTHPYVTTFSPNLAADKAYRALNCYINVGPVLCSCSSCEHRLISFFSGGKTLRSSIFGDISG